jgi:hypothetical protein
MHCAQIEKTMQMLMEDNDHTTEPYLQILFEETDLCGDGTLVIYDTLHWTLKNGSILPTMSVLFSNSINYQ